MFSKLFCVLVFASALDARFNSRQSFHYGGGLDCEIPSIEHGRVRSRPRSSVIKFTCINKYTLVGNKYATCNDGTWDEPMPVCVKSSPNCPIVPLDNGMVYPTHDNAYVTFFCLPEFKMAGNRTIYCDGRRWVGQPPKCINGSLPPALSCDFESPDLCGWRQDEFHDFDWRRWNKKTPSSMLHTGPDSDHTFGKNKSGYYMYIESTSQAENNSARLLSPIYDRKLSLNGCFKFFYHMYGSTTGGLRVFQKPDNMSLSRLLYLNATERYRYTLFEKWGDQGNEWHEFSGKLIDLGDNFQIVIQGIRGPNFLSDIAIDDVELKGENCTNSDTYVYTATGSPSELCVGRCMQNDTESTVCGCTVDCILNGNCCPDFFETCIFVDRSTYPYDDLPSAASIGEKMPQTEKLVGTTASINATDKEIATTSITVEIAHVPSLLPVITPKLTVTTSKLTVTTPKPTVTASKLTVTTSKLPVTTPKTTVTLPIKTTLPTPTTEKTTITIPTAKKIIPKLIFKTTETIVKLEDKEIEKATVKPVAKAVTTKLLTGAPVTAKVMTVKLTTVKPQLTTALNEGRTSKEAKSKPKVSVSVRSNSGISTTSIVFLLLGIICVMGSAVWFLRSARARRVIADLRGRSTRDPEVRYLTAHADED